MRARVLLLSAIVVLVTLPGRAQTPAPTYDASYSVGAAGDTYSGATTFQVDDKGVVTGTMTLTSPTRVTATLAGTVKDGTWTFSYPYAMPDNACTGTLEGTAKVTADRKSVTGTATVGGQCVPEPTPVTFSFTQREKK